MKNVQLWKAPPPLRMVTVNRDFRAQCPRHHHHLFYELALVLSGSCTWYLGKRRSVVVNSGEALLLRPGTMHGEEVSPDKKAHIAWVGFDFEGDVPVWNEQPIPLGDDGPEISGYFEAIAREHHQTDLRTQTRISLALQSLLLLLERRAEGSTDHVGPPSDLNSRQTHVVESAAHYFRNNLRDPLSIAQVATYHSLCPGHFSTLFRLRYQLNPRAFLRQARLQRAMDLLGESYLSLKEIAEQCGFVDAAHLCKSFKEAWRMTPRQFRSKMLHQKAAPAQPLR